MYGHRGLWDVSDAGGSPLPGRDWSQKAAPRLGSWQQDLQHCGGFVIFFMAFLKTVPFAIFPVLRQNFSWQNLSKTYGN